MSGANAFPSMTDRPNSQPSSQPQNPPQDNPPKEEIKREIKQEIAAAIQEGAKKEGDGKGGPAQDKQEKPKAAPSPTQKKITALVKNPMFLLIAGIVLLLVIGLIWHHASTHESTDDAYTTGHIHNISARVADTVLKVMVDDNERVSKGQVLVELDPADFQVQVDQAKANYEKAKSDFDRIEPLKGDEAISQQDFDTAKANLEVMQAQLQNAEDQLSYCTITSPVDGRVGRKQVESGNRVTVGGALMAVIDDAWVVANYKETQLGKIRVGQPVKIEIDAIPGKTFTGTVDSFSPGSGSTFALLPSDNATGNFTKIVQRVPVKIVFDPDSIQGYEDRIVPGLSCDPSIDVGKKGRDRDGASPEANK